MTMKATRKHAAQDPLRHDPEELRPKDRLSISTQNGTLPPQHYDPDQRAPASRATRWWTPVVDLVLYEKMKWERVRPELVEDALTTWP